jgi:hypothetical protein
MRSPQIGVLAVLLGVLIAGPVASLAEEEAFGEPVKGLACRLEIPEDVLPLGARPEFLLLFHYDGPDGVLLNRRLEAGRVELSFRDTGTGEVHRRRPDDGSAGMSEPVWAEQFVALGAGAVSALPLPVRLLTKKGNQLPPGTYEVTARYETDGKPLPPEVELDGKIWTGTISSPAARLTVKDAGPAEKSVELPARLTFRWTDDGLCYGCEKEDVATVKLTVRPGYYLAERVGIARSLDGAAFEESGSGVGTIGSSFGWWSFIEPEARKKVMEGASLAIRQKLTVLETSWPIGWHRAYPENGDHRVLWQGEISGLLPDSLRKPGRPAEER